MTAPAPAPTPAPMAPPFTVLDELQAGVIKRAAPRAVATTDRNIGKELGVFMVVRLCPVQGQSTCRSIRVRSPERRVPQHPRCKAPRAAALHIRMERGADCPDRGDQGAINAPVAPGNTWRCA